jgi:hypothetical protein
MAEVASITPSLDGKVWFKSIRYPFLNRPLFRILDQGDNIGRPARGGVFDIDGRSTPIAVTDLRGSQAFTLVIQTPDVIAARDMDLLLTSGDIFLIHVPPGPCPVQGGYVWIDTTSQQRPTTQTRWRFVLPCKVVTPPGPDVVGATLTWGTVERLYGSWTALLAANPTWADLLATVGSPDDLVVL